MRSEFQGQLKQLHRELVNMGGLCCQAIDWAVSALERKDRELAEKVVLLDGEIDQLERDIEALCLKLLLKQQPVAGDLRQISAAMKMITDMERIGDQAGDIAEIIPFLDICAGSSMAHIGQMGKAAIQMVQDSVEAYVKADVALARQVIGADDVVDEAFDQIRSELIGRIASRPEEGEAALDLLMIAKYLERIGDHATNIAQWVAFSVTGVRQSDEGN